MTVVTLSAAILVGRGLSFRIPSQATEIAEDINDIRPECEDYGEAVGDRQARICYLGKRDDSPRFLVWGDSHAVAISPALHKAALQAGVSGLTMTNGGCRPLIGVTRRGKNRCQIFNDDVAAFVEDNPSIRQIYLVGYWRVPLLSHGYDNSNYLIMDEETRFRSPLENRAVFKRGLERTLAAMSEKEAYLVEDIAEIGSQFGKSAANSVIRQRWLGTNLQKKYFFNDLVDEYDRGMAHVLARLPQDQFNFIEVKPTLCDAGKCPLLMDGKLVYSDGDHLSHYGALLLTPLFAPLIASLATGQ